MMHRELTTVRFWDADTQRLKYGYLRSVDEVRLTAEVVTNEGDLGGTSYVLPWRLVRRIVRRKTRD